VATRYCTVGERNSRLTAVSFVETRRRRGFWLWSCDCGGTIVANVADVRGGNTKSCGCLRKESCHNRAHGLTGTKIYSVWKSMLARCRNKAVDSYPNYGGRGIKVCERWQVFDNFFADVGHAPLGMSLDRIDNNGNYDPENCRWATQTEQCRNTRRSATATVNGQTKTFAEWSEISGISRGLLSTRRRILKYSDAELLRPVKKRGQ